MANHEHTVIVLSAGASAEAGVPAQDDFLKVAKRLAEESHHRNSDWYSGLVDEFQSRHLRSENVERLLVAAELLREFPFIDLNNLSNAQDGILTTSNHRPAKYLSRSNSVSNCQRAQSHA